MRSSEEPAHSWDREIGTGNREDAYKQAALVIGSQCQGKELATRPGQNLLHRN